MSDSLIVWNPRIDEPSNICPLVKKSSSSEAAGTLKCCMTPGRSQKRTSTNLTSLSLRYARTSSVLLNIHPPTLIEEHGLGAGLPNLTGHEPSRCRFRGRLLVVSRGLRPVFGNVSETSQPDSGS